MSKQKITGQRLFVLDTNILMHDPTALFRFAEHDIFLPMVVLEEMDAHKRGVSEVSRNVRQVNRTLDGMVSQLSHEQIIQGVPIADALMPNNDNDLGRIYFQVTDRQEPLPISLPGNKADNSILATSLFLQNEHRDKSITLITKDINLRIKAGILGIHTEDYYNDSFLDDINSLHNNPIALPDNFWQQQADNMESWQEKDRSHYRLSSPLVKEWYINDCLHYDGEQPFDAIVDHIEDQTATLSVVKNFRHSRSAVWGINARNREQNFALNVLLNPDIDFVTLLGAAGSGKTLLALAAGLSQVMDENRYREIIMTRVTVPLGNDIGFLPGTEEEKMTPWMGAVMDNLEILQGTEGQEDWQQRATHELLQNKIKIRSLNFMRGRTFLNRFIIIDEAQNLTSKQMKTLITRAGPGSKVICLGDLGQIDTPYITTNTSGLAYAVDRFKSWPHSAHITLARGERSKLAAYAADHL